MTSYGGISSQDTESISRRLRDAERARAEAERAHSEALAQLRNARANLDSLAAEQLQSRVRELEKKAALETVKCEELQLELSASMRARSGISGHVAPTTVTWANPQPASEIDRIMAKIEQDNRILAELEHSRGTTIGMQPSGSNPGLGEYPSPSPSPLPHSYTGVGSHIPICQSSTMPTLSSHANQFTMPNSNSMAYSMSGTHNPSAYGNPMPPYSSANTYGFPNAHQVTFTNPVTAPSVSHNLSQISSALAGIQSNMQNLNLGSGLTGTMSAGLSGLNTVPTCLTSGLTSTLGGLQSGLTGGLSNPLSSLGATHLSGLSTSLAGTGTYGVTGTYTNPLLSSGLTSNQMNIKLKPLDEIDMALGRYGGTSGGVGRVATPVTPHQPSWNLGLDTGYGTDRMDRITGLNSGFASDARGLSRILPNSGLDIDARNQMYMNGGAAPEGTVDMLDIPGKGRCGVYLARFSYEPPDVESAESELPICAGDYLLVWGPLDTNATMLDAETLDGRRGLVPATFVQRLIGDDLLEFHQAVVATLRDSDETGTMIASETSLSRDVARLSEMADLGEGPEDDDNIPAPRQLTLERQLNKSVLIGWTAPEGVQQFNIDSYHVYVDGTLKTTIKATERTRALVEGVDANRPHRISVRSVTGNRRTSRDAACTMVIGRDTANMGPTCVRASNVTCSSAIISWLPANSNHQHVVCVNNVEVRTVKPGVYRHTITGLAPSTQYRVTVRAKHLRAGPPQPGTGAPVEEAPGAYTDFRTLPKGLPDPPNEIMVEAGPQDGTLLVTWQPVQRPPASGPVTGYAVYADGKKVTDVDSPTGDHALIDIGKLLSMNPRCVTVRTKSRDSQSSDSIATPIPPQVLRGIAARMQRNPNQNFQRMPQGRGPQPYPIQQHHQQVIEHDENLSDKEIYPTTNRLDPTQPGQPASGFGTGLLKSIFDKITPSQSGIPAIEITKEAHAEICSEDEICEPQRERRRHTQQQTSQPQQVSQQQSAQQYPSTGPYHGTQQHQYQQPGQGPYPNNQQQYPGQQFQNPLPRNHLERGRPPNPHQMQQGPNAQYGPTRGGPVVGPRNIGPRQQGPPQQVAQVQPTPQKRCRNFVALFDYDPQTMSPNPESCDEELPFTEGDEIKIWGEKDADGFYWGECRGRRGYVPHNMVSEVEPSASNARPRERWSDSYATQPVKRMVALYDYDPQELSPNVDSDAELSFQTGQIITIYGEMDDDGFYMAEIEGVRGLVPSNFLAEAPLDQYGGSQNTGQAGPSSLSRGGAGRGRGQGPGPGARGPPPPPRDNIGQNPRPQQRKADACPLLPSQLDHNTSVSNPEQANSQQVLAAPRGRGAGVQPLPGPTTTARTSAGNISTPTLQSPAQSSLQQMQQQMQQPSTSLGQMGSLNSPASAQPGSPATRRGGPSVVPQPVAQPLMQQPPAAQPVPGQPNLMQKFTEITAPGGDILSKGKELIFMKFGLGGK